MSLPNQHLPPSELGELQRISQAASDLWKVLISPQLQALLFPVKIVFLLFTLIFIVITVYFLWTTTFVDWWFLKFFKEFLVARVSTKERMWKRWKRIKKAVGKGSEAQRKLGLIEASSLLDAVLQEKGEPRESLEERLQRYFSDSLSELNKVLEAQRVCRDISRDPDYHLSKEKAREVLDVLEKTFRELDIL